MDQIILGFNFFLLRCHVAKGAKDRPASSLFIPIHRKEGASYPAALFRGKILEDNAVIFQALLNGIQCCKALHHRHMGGRDPFLDHPRKEEPGILLAAQHMMGVFQGLHGLQGVLLQIDIIQGKEDVAHGPNDGQMLLLSRNHRIQCLVGAADTAFHDPLGGDFAVAGGSHNGQKQQIRSIPSGIVHTKETDNITLYHNGSRHQALDPLGLQDLIGFGIWRIIVTQ